MNTALDQIRACSRNIEDRIRHIINLKEAITGALDSAPPDVDSIDTFNECIGNVIESLKLDNNAILEIIHAKGGTP